MKNLLLTLLLLISFAGRSQVVSCGPPKRPVLTLTHQTASPAYASGSSVRDGLWSDPGTWGGLVPLSIDQVTIIHKVTIDVNTTVAGITVPGSLIFSPDKNITLQSSKNIIVTGLLQMRPTPFINHLLRFINVDESKFIGGGEDPMDSDVGLWVMNGRLDLQGSAKTGWTWAAGGINQASTSVALRGPPVNWSIGDELMITPTKDKDYTGFEVVTIRLVSGTTLTTTAIVNNHPQVNNQWTSEVCNLTRNVRIEGTATGKSHVFIRSAYPQNIQYVQFRYLGPRKDQAMPGDPKQKDGIKEFVLGRYGLHFHHCMEGSRGSVVEGNVMRDIDNHSYVTHGSNGVKVHDCVAYNVTETAYWWDEGPQHASHDIEWVKNVAALVKYVPRSVNIENSEGNPTLSSRGFLLGHGDGNVCDSNVAVGTMGDTRDGGGYKWEAVSNSYLEGVWRFVANLSHNCNTGLITWQNVQMNHVVDQYTAYNNFYGIFHGAYINAYRYVNCTLFNNPLIIHAASSNEARLRFENITVDAGGGDYAVIIEGNSEVGMVPILIRNLKAINYRLASVLDSSGQTKHSADIIQSDVKVIMAKTANPDEVVRVQPSSGVTMQYTRSGTIVKPAFAPTFWGTGNGLNGEYFNNPDFTSPAFTRVDAYIGFSEWKSKPPHHLIKYTTYSMRWTGQIQPQFSENYTFNAGSAKLLIGGKQVTGPVALKAGELYPIEIDYIKSNSIGEGMVLLWTSPSIKTWSGGWEYVPQSQLYPPDSGPPPPVNKPPLVSAGQDQTIQLPVNSVTLSGVGNDPDGSIAKYEWVKVSGGSAVIGSPASSVTAVSGLIEGAYTFRIYATDNSGAVSFDDVSVTVKAALPPPNKPPVATATYSKIIFATLTLTSSATDPEGGVLSYKWEQLPTDSPAVIILNGNSKTATVQNMSSGNYLFRLTVTDDKGASVVVDVQVVI